MWLKEKNAKGILFLVLTFFLILFAIFINKYSDEKEVVKSVSVERFYNSEEVELALYYNLSAKMDGAADIFIRWWNKPETSDYYLFLPEGLRGKELSWLISSGVEVYIENKKVEEYDDFDLEEGVYEVRIVANDYERDCNLEVMYTSKIASFFFETKSGSLAFLHENKENREMGNYCLLNDNGKVENAGSIRNIHGRGNNAWFDSEKKSYQVTLENKVTMLGMPESRKWLLMSNACDDTLTRNEVAYAISEGLGFEYTPDSKYIEVYANGEYLGLYSLTEKVEIENNRVSIRDMEEEMERLNGDMDLSTCEFFMEQQGNLYSTKGYYIPNQPEDISGGYLLELELLDRYGLEASGFITSRMQGVVFNSPEYASYEQVSYIANMYQDFEDAMYSEDGYSPYTGKHFSEYIDMESFASKYLLEELVKNLDGSYTSQFFYKPDASVSDKFFAGPVWDYDKSIAAYGVTDSGIDLHIPEQIYVASEKDSGDLWYGLCGQDAFMDVVKEIYVNRLVETVDKVAKQDVFALKEQIYESAKSNHIRWNVYGQYECIEEKMAYYDEKIQEQSDFLINRMAFLAEEWGL